MNLWKKRLPDGGKYMKRGYEKKKMKDFSQAGMEKFLTESCRGEATHLLAIMPFWVFGLFTPGYVVPIMLVYSLAVNLPCIIAQRYNRPRIIKLMNRGSDPHNGRKSGGNV
ncbi:glycosyl-4,4'-diaponeurosporenoate acyltransferase [Parasporobacterium paucivorans DSM 15970]|uniref:Glycosyl-4,4'-diaponeurosporenoate acyltransferase n=1 Tax=Parasporobacterium paucivorans DSM 15970 TaxID=1122934 RepID=A0A1M6GK63_9FIRM|nr:glycosyl-4,4'-diaponeurosporenoate acyltransferase [Parasporobacterium paucivorans DSM 15970]